MLPFSDPVNKVILVKLNCKVLKLFCVSKKTACRFESELEFKSITTKKFFAQKPKLAAIKLEDSTFRPLTGALNKNVHKQSPVEMSHTRIVLSQLELIKFRQSCEISKHLTMRKWPLRLCKHWLESMFQILITLSAEQLATRLIETFFKLVTHPWWAWKIG